MTIKIIKWKRQRTLSNNQEGYILQNTKAANCVFAKSLDSDHNVVFIVFGSDTIVDKYKRHTIKTLLGLFFCCPRGECHTMNGDLFVSMRSLDVQQSIIVRYSCSTETQNVILGGSFFCCFPLAEGSIKGK